ncbi:MAG: excinuclease ABC subunit UvrC [Spirochaetales bacterium]|nr:excinuclease ABC subunit UvrC [Spirochaetales bacterium]
MKKSELSLSDIPSSPGVYLYKDVSGNIIYIGKAKNLKKRVSSYFSGKKDIKTSLLVKRIEDLEFIITNSEYEALLLENNLIKSHKPKYNINLKDGKTYPVVRITNEEFPRVFKTRRIINDGSRYFGPFPNATILDSVLDLIQKEFPIRRCRNIKSHKSPCLYYHLGLCAAPCAGYITKDEYSNIIDEISLILEGNLEKIKQMLKSKMEEFSKVLKFEEAARYRDFLAGVGALFEKQGVEVSSGETKDYVALSREGSHLSFAVFQIYEGRLCGRDIIQLESYSSDDDAFLQFMMQYYPKYHQPPSRIFVESADSLDLLNKFFKETFDSEIELLVPESKRDLSVLKMARENSKFDLNKRLRRVGLSSSLEILKQALKLSVLPSHIEGFDISHFGGKFTIASLVYFKNGVPDKSEYRYFKIKSVGDEIDDYQSIREAVARRYRRVLNEGKHFPDLIVIDGGLGQVSAAKQILEALGCEDFNIVGLAKREDLVIFPDGKSLKLESGNEGLRLLQHVRDETHRFATNLNKDLRNSELRFSLLEKVPGVGAAYSKVIMEKISSVEELKFMSAEELSELTKVPIRVCRGIVEFFNRVD